MRAIAVVAVMLNHLVGWPVGGFVGVDVFFVVSGFLITGLLLREYDRTGRISFVGFYKRRIKRIFPAATLVLVVSLAVFYWVFNTTRWLQTAIDAMWAFLFAANWRYASEATDYFAQGEATSPLQHYWSLGVEEQFYLLWPWLMLLALLLVGRFLVERERKAARLAAGLLIGLITVTSFVWAMYESAAVPERAYFSTFSRVWELGIGAVLATAIPLLERLPRLARPLFGWVGIFGIGASLWLITPQTVFPAPAGLLPVLATALVIVSGTGAEHQRYLFPVASRPVSYVGDTSYSLYLWHFPVFIGAEALIGPSPAEAIAALVVAVALGVFSYELFEDPIRRSNWLGERPHAGRRKRSTVTTFRSRRWVGFLTAFIAATAVSVSMVALAPHSVARSAIASPVVVPTADGSTSVKTYGPEVTKLQQEIDAALADSVWPDDLSPTLDEAIGSAEAATDVSPCGYSGRLVDIVSCTWGASDPEHRIVTIGDSTSMTYVNPLRLAMPAGWALTSLGTFGCRFIDVSIAAGGTDCAGRKSDAVKQIQQLRPDVLIIANAYWQAPLDGGSSAPNADEWEAALRASVQLVASSVKRIVFLAAPPSTTNPSVCYTKQSAPIDCVSTIAGEWRGHEKAETELATEMKGVWVDSSEWFCSVKYAKCPIYVGNVPVRSDLTHMTVAYGAKIAGAVAETFTSMGIWDAAP